MLLYQKIHEYIVELIKQDPTLSKLPSERTLQEHFKSTRITVREALVRLEAQGIIYRLNRKGWFVNNARLRWDPVKKVDFYALAQEQGFDPKTTLVSIQQTEGQEELKTAFNLSPREPLLKIERQRFLDGRPVLFETIYCRYNHFPDLEKHSLEGSLTQIFAQHYKINVTHERSKVSVSAFPTREANAVEQNDGASCLKIIRQRFDEQNQLVDYNIEYWVHGAIELEMNSSGH